MTESSTLRYRTTNKQRNIVQNGDVDHQEKKNPDTEFTHRESLLTVLIETSPHIKAIYHIFVVIMIVLLFNTVIYDFVEHGMITVGIESIISGFGDIGRAAKLWLFELAVALAFYPALRLYAAGTTIFKRHAGLFKLWSTMGVIGLAVILLTLLAVPTWNLGQKHLAMASAVTVTCEMLRYAMKISAISMACIPRCHGEDKTPLPTFKHYLYYLFAPTLLYRDEYPRTKETRWTKVMFHFMEVAAVIFYLSFLWERFILPNWSDYGKEPKVEAGTVVRGMFACVLPGMISFLCGFYCLLHAWLNAFAEILKFGDRLFYEDWWTTSQFSQYYRAWNRVVHAWLRDVIYRPLLGRYGRVFSTFAVFFISAVAHEVILALSLGFFYPILLLQFGVFGLLLLPLTATSGLRFPNALNLFMWMAFFFGNGLLWSFYAMEHFARENCPPAANDSFFIPKSWSCPEIVLKSNWKFQNPFASFY